MELEFWVTICLGHGDGGDLAVTVDVSKKEYALLKKCCEEDEDIEGYEGLENLCERVIEAARDENECCEPDYCDDIDYDDASYTIAMPDSIYNEVNS